MAEKAGQHRNPAFTAYIACLLVLFVGPIVLSVIFTGAIEPVLFLAVAVAAALLCAPLMKRVAASGSGGARPVREGDEEAVAAEFGSYPEAGMAAELLRKAGIRSVLVPLNGVFPYTGQSAYELRVLARDRERAVALLEPAAPRRRAYRRAGTVRRLPRRQAKT